MGLETQLSGAQLSGAQFAWNRRASLSVKFPVEQNRKGWEQFSLHFKPFKQAKREDNTISFAFPIVYCITPSFKPNEFILPLGNKYHPNMIQSECQQSKPPVNFTQTKNCLNLNLFRGLPFRVPFRVRVRGCFFPKVLTSKQQASCQFHPDEIVSISTHFEFSYTPAVFSFVPLPIIFFD